MIIKINKIIMRLLKRYNKKKLSQSRNWKNKKFRSWNQNKN